MALTPFLGRGNSSWDIPDPLESMVSLFANSPASMSLARDAQAVASTNVDWKETATQHVFKVDLPGLKKEEIQLQIEDGRTLCISGERSKEEVQKTDTWHRVERSRGAFMRKFRLPQNANPDQITAKVENGVLTINVPKSEPKVQSRNIAISGEGTGKLEAAAPPPAAATTQNGHQAAAAAPAPTGAPVQ